MPDHSWIIENGNAWPPKGMVRIPVSVSMVEIMRGCQTRAKFSYDTSLPQRRYCETKIGIAIHETLESISLNPPSSENHLLEIKERFLGILKREEDSSKENPREALLPTNISRIQWAINSLFRMYSVIAPNQPVSQRTNEGIKKPSVFRIGEIWVEVPVVSKNGRIKGRIDRIEFRKEGIYIIDYKTSTSTNNVEKYFDQIKLYAALYYESFGVWPSSAELNFPLCNRSIVVKVRPKECLDLLNTANVVIDNLTKRNAALSSNPGIDCGLCDYRPWCEDFWDFNRSLKLYSDRLGFSKLGIECTIISLDFDDTNFYLIVENNGARAEFNFSKSRFPHLTKLKLGDRLRILNIKVRGMAKMPNYVYDDYSEVFVYK